MLNPHVQVREEAGVLIADFWDCLRLDPAPVQDLRAKFEEHVRRGKRPEVVVDMNGVTFAGSAALGGFLALHRVVKPLGGRIIFCNVDAMVVEVFRVSKLDSLFAFASDVPAALAVLKSPPSADGATAAASERSSSRPPLRRGRNRSE